MSVFISMLALGAALSTPAQATTLNGGRCLPLDPTNPAYQVLCERFDQNPSGCETQRHICYWKSNSPFRPIDFGASEVSTVIATRTTLQ